MIKGRIVAESLRPGADIRLADLELIRLGRHDVSTTTLPPDERTEGDDQYGVVAGQPTVWTLVDFECPDSLADGLARALAGSLATEHGWYADFIVGDVERVVVFADRVFRYRIGDAAGRAEAVAWGRAAGTPEHQLDWSD